MIMSLKKLKDSSNWAYDLPEDLLYAVLDRLAAVSDYVRFAAVCKPWLSAARLHHKEWLKKSPQGRQQLPMLLIPNCESMTDHGLYSVVDKELVLKAKLHVPYYDDMEWCGSSHGWLIFNRLNDDIAPMLFNPFTRATIQLPPIRRIDPTDKYTYDIKIVLSEDLSLYPDTYEVLVFSTLNDIWLFRSGTDSWIHVQEPPRDPFDPTIISDAIYYRGQFYITTYGRRFFRVEHDDSSTTRAIQLLFRQNPGFESFLSSKAGLTESCNGRLLYIEEFYDNGYYVLTSWLRVYEVNLNHHDGSISCTELQSLDGETLFLGFSRSLSISAAEFPSCQPDCIYYTDIEYSKGSAAIGVHNIVCRNSVNYDPIPENRNLIGKLALIWIVPWANLNTTSLVAG